MSCTLCFRPVNVNCGAVGSYKLREILEKKYGYPHILDYQDIPYFQALVDADVYGASGIIEAINAYGVIEIYKEC